MGSPGSTQGPAAPAACPGQAEQELELRNTIPVASQCEGQGGIPIWGDTGVNRHAESQHADMHRQTCIVTTLDSPGRPPTGLYLQDVRLVVVVAQHPIQTPVTQVELCWDGGKQHYPFHMHFMKALFT